MRAFDPMVLMQGYEQDKEIFLVGSNNLVSMKGT
jgi:hypothetical protein